MAEAPGPVERGVRGAARGALTARATLLLGAALLLCAALPLGGCAGRGFAPPSEEPAIVGIVTRVTPATAGGPDAARGSVLVEENPDEVSGSAKMALRITDETLLLRWNADAGGYGTLPLSDLRAGARVRAWVTGPVAESYPSQARAHTIVVEGADGRDDEADAP